MAKNTAKNAIKKMSKEALNSAVKKTFKTFKSGKFWRNNRKKAFEKAKEFVSGSISDMQVSLFEQYCEAVYNEAFKNEPVEVSK